MMAILGLTRSTDSLFKHQFVFSENKIEKQKQKKTKTDSLKRKKRKDLYC